MRFKFKFKLNGLIIQDLMMAKEEEMKIEAETAVNTLLAVYEFSVENDPDSSPVMKDAIKKLTAISKTLGSRDYSEQINANVLAKQILHLKATVFPRDENCIATSFPVPKFQKAAKPVIEQLDRLSPIKLPYYVRPKEREIVTQFNDLVRRTRERPTARPTNDPNFRLNEEDSCWDYCNPLTMAKRFFCG